MTETVDLLDEAFDAAEKIRGATLEEIREWRHEEMDEARADECRFGELGA